MARHIGTLGRAGQIFAIAFLLLIYAMIVHKSCDDISRIADKHSGKEFWREVARHVLGNLAGGAKKKQE